MYANFFKTVLSNVLRKFVRMIIPVRYPLCITHNRVFAWPNQVSKISLMLIILCCSRDLFKKVNCLALLLLPLAQ